jgi:hypothetical protein
MSLIRVPAFDSEFLLGDLRLELLLLAIPQYLAKTDRSKDQLLRIVEGLKPAVTYRVYAQYNIDREVTGFVARPYWGGIWFPETMEVKIFEITLPRRRARGSDNQEKE